MIDFSTSTQRFQVYEDSLDENPVKVTSKNESMTGAVYNKTVKVRKSFAVKAIVNEDDKNRLESINTEDYITFNIKNVNYTGMIEGLRFAPIRGWKDNVYDCNFELQDRGW